MNRKTPRGFRSLKAADWLADLSPWTGRFDGEKLGVNVTVLTFTQAERGDGPPLHVHEYGEIFIVRRGKALFRVGDLRIEAEEGDVLYGPPNIPHTFKNIGDTPLETTDIHLSERFAQVEVEDNDPDW